MIKVFISSPYTGNEEQNVFVQHECANELIELGVNPFIPLLYHYQELKFQQPYEKWLAITLDWLKSCSIMLRLPGDSYGADQEEKLAHELGIPVVYSIKELEEYINS